MENNNVNVTTNEKKEAEKKPSVFKTICGFITWGIGALLFITVMMRIVPKVSTAG